LTKLRHPNILKCYDVIREISHCYIVTEYCNEGDLSSLLKKKRRMSETEVIKIMQDIVSGFIEIGENKFLHRDLKLANIFMSNGVAKIADFGFAKKSYASFER
jgi:serine/threonine protein kinase